LRQPFDIDEHNPKSVQFLQHYFFLILFRSALDSAGVQPPALDVYSELNFCIQGTIAAADNLFDGEDKRLLPLAPGPGRRFNSILQLLCVQRLIHRILERVVSDEIASEAACARLQRELLSRMASIGALEGAEEGGVGQIIDPETMVERVHRVRGGTLFALGFVAPGHLEPPARQGIVRRIESAMSYLGTAFQMVDDLTDFAFDVSHRRHNLLAAQVQHAGTPEERAALRRLVDSTAPVAGEWQQFGGSAAAVLRRAQRETRRGLEALQATGFWFPPHLADTVVCALVGGEESAPAA
jgi:hypothetical protein